MTITTGAFQRNVIKFKAQVSVELEECVGKGSSLDGDHGHVL